MKKTGIYIGIVLIFVIGVVLWKSCRHQNITSHFDQDHEGWTVIGDAQEGSAIPDYRNDAGNPGGYISADDNTAGGVWYWSAPEKFLGNRSSSFGKILSFSLKQSSTDNQFDADDIILAGADMKIVYNTAENPDITWTDYSVRLSGDSGWKYNDSNGDPVSRNDFVNILKDLKALQIRGEYVTGEDTGGLDNVILYAR